MKLKRKRIQSSKSSSSGSSTQRVPHPKLSRRSVGGSHEVPPASGSEGEVKKKSVAARDGYPGPRRKISVSGPRAASNQTSEDNSSDGDLRKGKDKRTGKDRRKKSVATSSDDDKCKLKGRSAKKSVCGC